MSLLFGRKCLNFAVFIAKKDIIFKVYEVKRCDKNIFRQTKENQSAE